MRFQIFSLEDTLFSQKSRLVSTNWRNLSEHLINNKGTCKPVVLGIIIHWISSVSKFFQISIDLSSPKFLLKFDRQQTCFHKIPLSKKGVVEMICRLISPRSPVWTLEIGLVTAYFFHIAEKTNDLITFAFKFSVFLWMLWVWVISFSTS